MKLADCLSDDYQSRSLCKLPLRSRQQHHTVLNMSSAVKSREKHTETSSLSVSQQEMPSVAGVKVRVILLNMTVAGPLWPVTCPARHMTHVFLSCDTSAACWAGANVTFSRHSDTWAIPTSQSCPVPMVGPPLPPSFPCRSGEQRVPYSLVCDHRRDCLDGSDEVFCQFLPCLHLSQFQCRNKQVCHNSPCPVCLFLGCLASINFHSVSQGRINIHSVSQGWIHWNNSAGCYTLMEAGFLAC